MKVGEIGEEEVNGPELTGSLHLTVLWSSTVQKQLLHQPVGQRSADLLLHKSPMLKLYKEEKQSVKKLLSQNYLPDIFFSFSS